MPEVLEILCCTIFSILSLIASTILIASCKQIYCNKWCTQRQRKSSCTSDDQWRNNDMNTYIKNATFIGLFSYVSSLIVSFIATILEVIYTTERDYPRPLLIAGVAFYMIGRWTILLSFIQRIDYTFRYSIYTYSKCTIRFMYGTIFFLLVSLFIYIPLGLSEIIPDNDIKDAIAIYGILIWITIEFIFSNILMFAFIKKLFNLFVTTMKQRLSNRIIPEIQLASSASDLDTNSNRNRIPSDSVNSTKSSTKSMRKQTEDNVDPETLNAMTKYTLLVVIALSSSTMTVLIGVVLTRVYHMFIIMGADAFINSLCIFMFNRFAKRIYSIFCKYPDKCCKCLCVRCISCVFLCKK